MEKVLMRAILSDNVITSLCGTKETAVLRDPQNTAESFSPGYGFFWDYPLRFLREFTEESTAALTL
jgi:hypothetical protein